MTEWSYGRWRMILAALLLLLVTIFVVRTWHWPLVGDAALMHYNVFLMDHGFAPYRDLVDPNMPGTYMLEGLIVHSFGGSAQVWRLFDFSLLACAGLAMIAIAAPYDWFAGVFAGALFALIHGRDGLIQLGQRDLVMAVCLLLGCALLFRAMRSASNLRACWMTGLCGVCIGAASVIKPTASLYVLLLVLAAAVLRSERRPYVLRTAWGAAGLLLPLAIALAFLVRWQATAEFVETLTRLVPALTVLDRRSLPHLLAHSLSATMLPLFFLWLPVAYARRAERSFERAALMLGVVLGLLSFYMQRKGYPYHRYPSEAFLLLLMGIDFTAVLRAGAKAASTVAYRCAAVGVVVGVLVVGGGSLRHALWQDWHNQEFDAMLQSDLGRLGGSALSGQVQCLDSADGCVPALFHMKLVQATGFLYDCYLLAPDLEDATKQRYRDQFWRVISRRPPMVFVVSSNECTRDDGLYRYSKLSRWPWLDDYLSRNYRLDAERLPPHMVNWGSSPSRPMGYRIYVKRSFVEGAK